MQTIKIVMMDIIAAPPREIPMITPAGNVSGEEGLPVGNVGIVVWV